MMKELVIICFFRLSFAFSIGKKTQRSGDVDSESPQFGIYTDVDVNNPNVLLAAQHALESLQKEPACYGFTLLDVSKAKHKLGGSGIMYELKLRFKTADRGRDRTLRGARTRCGRGEEHVVQPENRADQAPHTVQTRQTKNEGKKKQISGDVDSGSPQEGIYTDVDVNDPNVQATAQRVLANLQKDPVCSGFTLLDVTKAKHKQGGAGVIYDLKLRFKTADNETKKCKLKVHGDVIKISGRQMSTESKPTLAPCQKGCRYRDLNPTYVTSEEVIDEEDDC